MEVTLTFATILSVFMLILSVRVLDLRGSPVTKGQIFPAVLTYSAKHRWLYLPNMRPDEIGLVKQADSRSDLRVSKHAFHTSFKSVNATWRVARSDQI